MATLTLLAQLQLVLVIFLVAAVAIPGSIFEARSLMATLAGCRDMPPNQRKTGEAMVKTGDTPRTIVVTGFAGSTRLTFMLVILLVTTETISCCIAVAAKILMTR